MHIHEYLYVLDELYKIASINLSPNTPGQVSIGLMVNPPKPGDVSYKQFIYEKDSLLNSLKRRARMMTDAFNALEGVTCQETEGAMYSFPRITIPPAAIAAAKASGKEPDVMYCLELLEETGMYKFIQYLWLCNPLYDCLEISVYVLIYICHIFIRTSKRKRYICVLHVNLFIGLSCVPGSGFKQVEGTFHIRTTILPAEDKFDDIINRFTTFHKGFMKRYSGVYIDVYTCMDVYVIVEWFHLFHKVFMKRY
jgi:glutamate--glyoxylate aminotransferase